VVCTRWGISPTC